MRYLLRSIASSTVGAPLPKSTRRSATVTISAPLAAIAARVSSRFLYLPVPTMIREVKVRLPSVQLSLISGMGGTLASSDKRDQLDAVAGGEHRRAVLCARHDLAVALDGNATFAEAELDEQRGDRGAFCHGAGLSVDDDIDAR